jgi:hypothetical protein
MGFDRTSGNYEITVMAKTPEGPEGLDRAPNRREHVVRQNAAIFFDGCQYISM